MLYTFTNIKAYLLKLSALYLCYQTIVYLQSKDHCKIPDILKFLGYPGVDSNEFRVSVLNGR